MPHNLVKTVSERLNSDFLKKKLKRLNDEPLILKNLPEHLIKFSGNLLAEVTGKGFDIVICKNDDVPNVVKAYSDNDIERLTLKVSKKIDFKKLEDLGFEKVPRVWEKGEFSFLGDVLIIWPFNSQSPVRVSFFSDVVESIHVIEKESFQKKESLTNFEIISLQDVEVVSFGRSDNKFKCPLIFLKDRGLDISHDFDALDLSFRDIPSLNYHVSKKSVLFKILEDYKKKNYQIIYSTCEVKKSKNLFKDIDALSVKSNLKKGFLCSQSKFIVLSDFELFGRVDLDEKDWLKQILPGDYVVHEDHGIGVFERVFEDEGEQYIEIGYAEKDKLLVPLSQGEKVSKYVGGKGLVPKLTKLSGGTWKRIKKKAKIDSKILAKELLQIYAMREYLSSSGYERRKELFSKLEEFVKDFEFKDTHDQSLVTQEIFDDMVDEKLMDRLLVGDVGFGKTEMAMRAAFLSLQMGKQVAFLAPTTILVEQHFSVFRNRLEKYGFKVKSLSRFLSSKEKSEILEKLEAGEIDVVIGTHSLLHEGVKFKDLGLIVIDEEQKFGVRQKEKMKEKRLESHVLSMSATPIPRSLGMSLSGIRDISMLFSPPEGRKAVKNVVSVFDWDVVKKAIEFEVGRKGQVYFLHNRVVDIYFVQKKLNEMFPSLSISVLHGQMKVDDIARVMNAFCERKVDVLVCTTIIENGLDIPNVNTLIVDDASRFGLSQLYQIRGRIGRSDVQAYAHFLYKTMRGNTELRLDALIEASDLGSGFLLANRDLEIRGVGDLLGKEQSGNINAVGYGLFMKYLGNAVKELRSKDSFV